MPNETILNRRIKIGGNVVYPITRQQNVIGLQKTIKEKMAIVSYAKPQGTVFERQAWIQLDTDQVEDNYENSSVADPVEENFGSPEDRLENNFG